MSSQLSELVDKIKREGVEAAQQEAVGIRAEAEGQAARILADAKTRSEALLEQAKAEATRFEQTGREGLRQASRDVVLNLRKEIEATFTAILRAGVGQVLTGDALRDALTSLFGNWRADGAQGHEVLIPAAQWQALQASLLAALAAQIRQGLQIKPSGSLQAGFRIGQRDGSAYLDFSDAALVEYLMEYLNPKLADCLREGAR